ncbi:aspartate/glutamate racemase family protein [Alteromonas aestuariivivens]|uniref:Aspartate/glutamate racemase family protein n=1 Tax=Alteromonas aestuariivivens TaxID=1938339 RepID=A0A3D8MA08_9ALTE|nr:aspartate/glutamate racemase family protein [Alteromonas aestuariivivens]RDV26819.1 aspartate/glutamate racemase family protein [Alteromonas aestuariivivens]
MKTIGIIGGMSWESTQTYYRMINQGIKAALGGSHSAQIAMVSVDFAPIEQLQHVGDWAGTAQILIEAARQVEAAGADCLLIATNTMHKVAEEVQAAVDIPLLHIADATGKAIKALDAESVGLLGTAFTMEQPFYKDHLSQDYGLRVLIPKEADRALVHQIIYQQLCQGRIEDHSRQTYLRIIDHMAEQGAEAVILGCTEIGLLVQQHHTQVKLLDTSALHAQMAIEFALA